MKNNKIRIMLELFKYDVTDKECGRCPYAESGICLIFNEPLDWDKITLQFLRVEDCRFNTLNNGEKQ